MQSQTPPQQKSLSASEREVVTLLGQGHTAKSIASELGISVNAVNERLREARRKTGMGSSREVARLLKDDGPQETWDKQIGIEKEPFDTEQGLVWRIVVMCRARAKELLVMTLFVILAAAAIVTSPPVYSSNQAGLSADSVLADTGDAKQLHDRVDNEPIDPAWAEPAQRRLESIYSAIPAVGFVTVRCATEICEVTGLIAAAGRDRAIDSLRASALDQVVQANGFDRNLATAFREPAADTDRETSPATLFTSYWARRTGLDILPRVIATSPADGTSIAPGSIPLSVTFDRPLRDGDASFSMPGGAAAFPECDGLPALSADRRTIATHCAVQAGRNYVFGLDTKPLAQAGAAIAKTRMVTVRFSTRPSTGTTGSAPR